MLLNWTTCILPTGLILGIPDHLTQFSGIHVLTRNDKPLNSVVHAARQRSSAATYHTPVLNVLSDQSRFLFVDHASTLYLLQSCCPHYDVLAEPNPALVHHVAPVAADAPSPLLFVAHSIMRRSNFLRIRLATTSFTTEYAEVMYSIARAFPLDEQRFGARTKAGRAFLSTLLCCRLRLPCLLISSAVRYASFRHDAPIDSVPATVRLPSPGILRATAFSITPRPSRLSAPTLSASHHHHNGRPTCSPAIYPSSFHNSALTVFPSMPIAPPLFPSSLYCTPSPSRCLFLARSPHQPVERAIFAGIRHHVPLRKGQIPAHSDVYIPASHQSLTRHVPLLRDLTKLSTPDFEAATFEEKADVIPLLPLRARAVGVDSRRLKGV
ncbi:hypothetical protein B0H13DRAFT_2369290 [Mycena leptocephala]|nr:hypothetical protein B0H13DRAFT_2369290 [Mycena leptocephala]